MPLTAWGPGNLKDVSGGMRMPMTPDDGLAVLLHTIGAGRRLLSTL